MSNHWLPEAEEIAKDPETGQIAFQDLLLLSVAWSLEKIADELKRHNDRAEGLQQAEGADVSTERPKVDVYSHPECRFNYCPHPDNCRANGGCIIPQVEDATSE